MMSIIAATSTVGRQVLAAFKQHENGTTACAGRDTSPGARAIPMDSLLNAAGSVSALSQLLLFVYQLSGQQFRIDPSMVLTSVGFLWALSKLLNQVYLYFESFIESHLVCTIHITEDDQIYDHVIRFMSRHPAMRKSRQLMAETVYQGAWDTDDEGEPQSLFWTDGGDNDGSQYLNFSKQAIQSAPQFSPARGQTSFWHKGTRFSFSRFKEAFADTNGWGSGPMKDVESISISCYGRSTQPIKRLLQDSKTLYWEDTSQKTTIYRPRSKEMRRDYGVWQQVARRPIRPVRTVVLNDKKKHTVLADINEYLHPDTPRWYASRGIPLRRGYLFYGPPGTGKTSFSFALAGVFGINIYVISLQDGSITEEDLAALFIKLPRRCVILLEDIDSAGVRRDGFMSDAERKKGAMSNSPCTPSDDFSDEDEDDKGKLFNANSSVGNDEVASSTRQRGDTDRQRENNSNGVSLSGLLNAIDGVASHEGRVLIMTTNKLEALDEALVRPGRVDMQVGFTYATHSQIEELFQRMYDPPNQIPKASLPAKGLNAEKSSATRQGEVPTALAREAYEVDVNMEQIKGIATQFAKCIPLEIFSPAEIQGFLLLRKENPRRALNDVQAWVEASLKQKKIKSTIVKS